MDYVALGVGGVEMRDSLVLLGVLGIVLVIALAVSTAVSQASPSGLLVATASVQSADLAVKSISISPTTTATGVKNVIVSVKVGNVGVSKSGLAFVSISTPANCIQTGISNNVVYPLSSGKTQDARFTLVCTKELSAVITAKVSPLTTDLKAQNNLMTKPFNVQASQSTTATVSVNPTATTGTTSGQRYDCDQWWCTSFGSPDGGYAKNECRGGKDDGRTGYGASYCKSDTEICVPSCNIDNPNGGELITWDCHPCAFVSQGERCVNGQKFVDMEGNVWYFAQCVMP
ncbi:MAG TPA: hypothetical protein VJI71_00995 [Candidatus Norongarragalinales archaeon]|nr:hypothetical protein [Candidatus Norongarragalinales archaeon]